MGGTSNFSGFSEQDIEFMKKAIQVLCQSTNPLGKSIDFVTDEFGLRVYFYGVRACTGDRI